MTEPPEPAAAPAHGRPPPYHADWVSFDVFGTLISVRDGSYAAFQSILDDCGGGHVELRSFWEFWSIATLSITGSPTAATGRFARCRSRRRSPIMGCTATQTP